MEANRVSVVNSLPTLDGDGGDGATDGNNWDYGSVQSALQRLALLIKDGDKTAVLGVCVAVLATLLILTVCYVVKLRWRIDRMQGRTTTQQFRVPISEDSERSSLHPKKKSARGGAASPSAEQDFAAEDEST